MHLELRFMINISHGTEIHYFLFIIPLHETGQRRKKTEMKILGWVDLLFWFIRFNAFCAYPLSQRQNSKKNSRQSGCVLYYPVRNRVSFFYCRYLFKEMKQDHFLGTAMSVRTAKRSELHFYFNST